MKQSKFKFKNPKLAFVLLLIALFIVFLLYYFFILSDIASRNNFVNEVVEIADENETSIFNVQRIVVYSSATAVDKSNDLSLKNMDILQFSDIAINIDNTSSIDELTNENTVKELYIDNIEMTTTSDIGSKVLNYKNGETSGKYEIIETPIDGRINFKIINTNSENESTSYSEPTFYTDCSNPITLGYVNTLLTNHSMAQDGSQIAFNGKVLEQVGIAQDDISYVLNFKIHIINNANQKFVYDMKLSVDLNDENGGIYNGYSYRGRTTSGKEYQFFKEGN